jgi:hypothetical protein
MQPTYTAANDTQPRPPGEAVVGLFDDATVLLSTTAMPTR